MKFCLGKKYGIPMLVIQTAGFYLSGAGVERELTVQSSRLHLTMYVCMRSRFRNAIMDFTHAHTGTIIHALVGRMVPWPDKSEPE